MNHTKLFITIALLLTLLAACSPAAPKAELQTTSMPAEPTSQTASLPEISIDAADYSYSAPESLGSGWVRVKLTNSGVEPHHVQFLRLNDGVRLEQFQEALKQGEGPALALVQQMGGVGAIAPAGSAQAILNLPAGEYVILCFIPSPSDHLPHLAKGMVDTIKIEEIGKQVPEPTPALTVYMKDFLFEMPDTLPAGTTMIKIVNDGPEPHELNLLQLAEGKTQADVVQYLAHPEGLPPFIPVGGMNGLSAGLTGYLELDLVPGKYIAICNIPSPVAGQPHSMLGMIQEITIQ
jgi:hypothetical protein